MLWRTTRKPSTRELVRAEHRLQAGRRGGLWRWALVLVLGLLAAVLWLRLDARTTHEQQLAALVAEKHRLQAELEQSHLQLREAQAAEAQLLRRIAEMTTQVKRLQTDLAFFRQQKKNSH